MLHGPGKDNSNTIGLKVFVQVYVGIVMFFCFQDQSSSVIFHQPLLAPVNYNIKSPPLYVA